MAATEQTWSITSTRSPLRLGLGAALSSRDLLLMLGSRDLKLRYRQTALGVVWVLVQPLFGAGVLTFVFGRIARLPNTGIPYFLVAYSGFLLWQAFSSTLMRSATSLVGNSTLVSKIYFPRLVLPVSTLFSTLVDFAVASVVMAALLVHYGIGLTPKAALLPVWLTATIVLALGLGLLGGAVMVSYRDVQHLLPVGVQLLLYASPVGYLVTAVPAGIRRGYLVNPLAGLINGWRWSLLDAPLASPRGSVYALGAAGAVGLVGLLAFSRLEQRFADVI